MSPPHYLDSQQPPPMLIPDTGVFGMDLISPKTVHTDQVPSDDFNLHSYRISTRHPSAGPSRQFCSAGPCRREERNAHEHLDSVGDPSFKLLQDAGIDLAPLPLDFLQLYPHPALILVSSVPSQSHNTHGAPWLSAGTTEGMTSFPMDLPWTALPLFGGIHPLKPIWTNAAWQRLTCEPGGELDGASGQSLFDHLSLASLRRLGHWLSGSDDAAVRSQIDSLIPPLHKFRSLDIADDNPPPATQEDVSAASIILEFKFPGHGDLRLELTKTSMPIYQVVDGIRRYVSSHSFVALSATPRAPNEGVAPVVAAPAIPYQPFSPPPLTYPQDSGPQVPPAPKNSPKPDHRDRFKDVEDFLQDRSFPDQPVFIHRDGTVSRQFPPTEEWTPDNKLPLSTDKLLDTVDWSKTALGERKNWSPTLEILIQFLRMYPLCGSIWWGKEFTLIYNQMYGDNLPHHPQAFGMSGREAWGELWATLGPLTEVVLAGTPLFREDILLLLKADDNISTYETYQSQMWVSMKEADGSAGGVFLGTRYTTHRVIGDRRLRLIADLAARARVTRTPDEFYRSILDVFEAAPKEVPFAALYKVDDSTAPTSHRRPNSVPAPPRITTRAVHLKRLGTVGIPEGHESAPPTMNVHVPCADPADAVLVEAFPNPALQNYLPSILSTPTMSMRMSLSSQGGATSSIAASESAQSTVSACDSPIMKLTGATPIPSLTPVFDELEWPIADAILSREPVVVTDCSRMIQGYSIRVWDELPSSAVIIPIFRKHDVDTPSLVLIIGLSSRLPFDDGYKTFISTLSNNILEHFITVCSYHADAQRIEQSEALDRAKNNLFTNISHQLFTPLNLISGPLDDVLVDMKPGQDRDALIVARRHVRRLARLVNILMDVSRLEVNRLKTSFRRVNLGKITRDIAGLFAKPAEAAGLEFRLLCDCTPHDVFLDREMWEKMLFNLVGNACDYTKEGRVTVSVSYKEGEAVFYVKDSGVGIPALELQHMFSEGTGMALLFTRKLAEIHHGTLEIESRTAAESPDRSHGTKCTVRIPLGTNHLPPEVLDRGSFDPDSRAGMAPEDIRRWHSEWTGGLLSESGASPFSPLSPHSRGPTDSPVGSERSIRLDGRLSVGSGGDYLNRGTGINPHFAHFGHRPRGIDPSTLFFDPDDVVMVVDNDVETLRYIRSILIPFCRVVEVRDGQDALDRFEVAMPDVIIADAKLPRLDGLELLNVLRNGTREQQMVPFIILQSLHEAQGRFALNADDYVSKPFNARELVARVHIQLQLGKRRKTLEDMFDRRTQELRTLSNLSPVGIFRGSTEGYVTYTNERWHDLVGYPKDGRPITNWGEYVAEDQQQRVRGTWEAFHRGAVDRISNIARWKNGKWIHTTVVRLDPKVDGSDGCLGYLVDITERKLNEELQRQRIIDAEARQAEAEAAKQQQELLIDITSHEIRNPISSLMQCASLVKTNLTMLHEQFKRSLEKGVNFMPTDQQLLTIDEDLEALDSIYQCGLTQERISNDVLSLGKIQLDMLQMFDVETDLHAEAQKVISVFQNEARMKGISLSFELSPAFKELGIRGVMTDPLRLGQIITNLLANAIRFTASSPVRDVDLRLDVVVENSAPAPITKDTPVYVFVAVKDTGPGLTPAELDILFQRFSQASPKTHTVFGGSGLGLFVCRKITEVMGGRIEVVSEAGKGSTFRFFVRSLPVLAPPVESPLPNGSAVSKPGTSTSKAAGTVKSATANANAESTTPGPGAHPRRRILIVEDNLINQKVLARQLKHIGMEVDVASDGLEGLEKMRLAMATDAATRPTLAAVDSQRGSTSTLTPPPSTTVRPFDCVLMDLEMPVMDGYTATKHAREEEKGGLIHPTIIVALTGNARQALLHEAMADFDDVVVKPYRLDHLLKTMEDCVRRKRVKAAEGNGG